MCWPNCSMIYQQNATQFPGKSLTNINSSARGPNWMCGSVLGPKWLRTEVPEDWTAPVQVWSSRGPKWKCTSVLEPKSPRTKVIGIQSRQVSLKNLSKYNDMIYSHVHLRVRITVDFGKKWDWVLVWILILNGLYIY